MTFLLNCTIGDVSNPRLFGAYIQGKRTNVGSPWTDESGNPLPYLAPEMIGVRQSGHNMLILVPRTSRFPLEFHAQRVSVSYPAVVLCKI